MRLPNFLIIGAHKAGTTSLHYYVSQHPKIYMSPIKELKFFHKDLPCWDNQHPEETDVVKKYASFFQNAAPDQVCGEGTTEYLSCPQSPQRIKRLLPDCQIIAILRNPIDRAYAHFNHRRRLGRESQPSFQQALKDSDPNSPFGYISRGQYFRCLERYFQIFLPSQIKVCIFDDMLNNPQKLMNELFAFLDVPYVLVKTPILNEGWAPRYPILNRLILNNVIYIKLLGLINGRKQFYPESSPWLYSIVENSSFLGKIPIPKLEDETRKHVLSYFKEDILRLQELTKKDLSHWIP